MMIGFRQLLRRISTDSWKAGPRVGQLCTTQAALLPQYLPSPFHQCTQSEAGSALYSSHVPLLISPCRVVNSMDVAMPGYFWMPIPSLLAKYFRYGSEMLITESSPSQGLGLLTQD